MTTLALSLALLAVFRFLSGVLAMSDAKLFDDPDVLLNAATFIDIRDASSTRKPSRRRTKELLEAQEQRLRLLQRDGFTCRIGANGMTVFRGPAYDSRGGAA